MTDTVLFQAFVYLCAAVVCVPIAKRLTSGQRVDAAWVKSTCVPHVFGEMPSHSRAGQEPSHASRDCPPQRPLHDS